MTAIALTQNALRNMKRALAPELPRCGSAHLTEALAAACGYRTQAALLDHLRSTPEADPDYVLIDGEAFASRLGQLAGTPVQRARNAIERVELLHHNPEEGILRTRSKRWSKITFRSQRSRAWRNMMVAAVNAGIEQRLFTLRPGDNRWPGVQSEGRDRTYVYRFTLAGIPAIASVSDAGWDELSIHVALWPTPEGERWIVCQGAGFLAGEASTSGWLERRDGAWLQVPTNPMLSCRRARLATVVALDVRAGGFADRGSFRM